MQGTVSISELGGITIHTYTSPAIGLEVNTHLIELPTQIIAVDAQFGLPFAEEAAALARLLGKPITRLYISHDHPDHFFGAGVFKAPTYSLATTMQAIASNGDGMAAINHKKFPGFVPQRATVPQIVVTPEEEVIDGVRFEFREVQNSEAASMLVIVLPDHDTVLTQDLVYNNLHLFIAEGHLDGWRRSVDQLRAENYSVVIPGHGAPGDERLYDFVLAYLDSARTALAEVATGDQLKEAMTRAFPNAGGTVLLDIQNSYLFPRG
jgi:glyoxylase-like metal-dependent hydrolase (beta-lactamase superfamily II)